MDTECENFSTPVLVAVLLLCVTAAAFGASNWSCYVAPDLRVSSDRSKEQFEYLSEIHHQKTEAAQRGDGALVPLHTAVMLFFVGIAGAVSVCVVLFSRDGGK